MLYELILINEIEQRAKIIFLSVSFVLCDFSYEIIRLRFQILSILLRNSSNKLFFIYHAL